MPDVGSVKYQVELDQSGLDKDIKSTESTLSSKMDGLGKRMGMQLGYQVLKDVGSAFVAAGKAAVGFAADAVQTGMTFDSAMSQVAATMGVTVDQIQDLRAFAQEMGATTAFSATQAAEALNYMALAGYDAETSMSMLPNVLNLAAAGGMDLAAASDMVTDASSALGLSIEETTEMVDMMAKTSSITNTSVAQLGDAILTVGGTAKTLAYGTEEVNGVLGVLADNGIKGAEAGTKLRNIILAMTPTTDDAAAAWERLGVSAYTADGELRGLDVVFGELSAAMADMSDQEKTQFLSDMFNKADLSAVNALLSTTQERWGQVYNGIEECHGAAEQMANTQLDNLEGSVTLLKSAFEGVQIAISDQITPALKGFVDMASEGLGQVATALQSGDWDGAIAAVGEFADNATQKILDMLPAALEAGVQILESLVNGIMTSLPRLIPAASGILQSLVNGLASFLPQLAKSAVDIVVSLVNFIADNMPLVIDTAMTVIMTLVEGLVNNIPQLIDAALKIVTAFGEYIMNNFPAVMKKGGEIIGKLIEGIIAAIPKVLAATYKVITGINQSFTKVNWGEIGINILRGVANGISGGLSIIRDAAVNAARSAFEAAKSFFGISSPSKLMRDQIGKQIPAGMALGIEEGTGEVEDSITELSRSVMGTLDVNLPDINSYVGDLGAAISTSSSAQVTVPLYLDGREIARGTAWYMNEQLAWEAR